MIELARSLPAELPESHREIRFVLFDGEEDPPGCTDKDFQFCALRGSRAYATAHPGQIGDMILLDYIANRGAQIRREANSNVRRSGISCARRRRRSARLTSSRRASRAA